jgi:hypothetical protein
VLSDVIYIEILALAVNAVNAAKECLLQNPNYINNNNSKTRFMKFL